MQRAPVLLAPLCRTLDGYIIALIIQFIDFDVRSDLPSRKENLLIAIIRGIQA